MSEITEQRLATAGWSIGVFAIALVGFGWVVFAAFWAAPGVHNIDGLVYHAMIDAFARQGSLFVSNGYEEHGTEALKIFLMRDAGGRLAPQYPGGWGIVAAPAYLALGLRGVILLNAVASALTLPLVWLAARALFEDRRLATQAALIYGLATFAVVYAFGVWPHGVTTFLVTAAVAAVVVGWRGTPAAELRGALIAGLVLGLGVNIRVDALFAAAPLGIWLLGAGRRPYAGLGLLLAGLVPGLAIATAINQAKFGIPSPVTYGMSEGGTSVGYDAQLAPLVVAGALAALALGMTRVRAVLFRPAGLTLTAVGGLALLLALPGPREALIRIAEGFWVLVIDFQAHPVPSRGLTVTEDGTIRAYGLVKKALLQSLPYAAAVLVLAPRLWRGPDRAAVVFCALFVGLGIVPFAFSSWHGGMANNMRYFLNLVPVLVILSAAALREIAALAEGRAALAMAAVLAIGGGAIVYGVEQGYPLNFVFQHTLPNAVILGVTGLSVLIFVTQGTMRGGIATTLRGLVALGLLIAFFSAWVFDLQVSQQRRAITAGMVELSRDLPGNALVVTFTPEAAGFRLNRPPALTAQANFMTRKIDAGQTALVARAFAEGRPVFAHGRFLAEQMLAKGAAGALAPRYGIAEDLDLYEMTPPDGVGGDAR